MVESRYQHWGPNGIEWTKWFVYSHNDDCIKPKKVNKLLHEYRYVKEPKKE